MEGKSYVNGERVDSILGVPHRVVFMEFSLIRPQKVHYRYTDCGTALSLYICDDDFSVEGFEFMVDDIIATYI